MYPLLSSGLIWTAADLELLVISSGSSRKRRHIQLIPKFEEAWYWCSCGAAWTAQPSATGWPVASLHLLPFAGSLSHWPGMWVGSRTQSQLHGEDRRESWVPREHKAWDPNDQQL